MKAPPRPYDAAPSQPEALDEWLLSLDDFTDGSDLGDDDQVWSAYDDPARQPLD